METLTINEINDILDNYYNSTLESIKYKETEEEKKYCLSASFEVILIKCLINDYNNKKYK